MKTANLMPGVAQVVAISVGHSDEGLDGINVLLLHFCNARAGCQQGEPRQRLHIRVPLQLFTTDKKRGQCVRILHCTVRDAVRQLFRLQYLYGEDARYPDGKADPLQTQRGHLGVVAVLKTHAESGQEGCPRQLRNNRPIRFYNLCVKLCTSLIERVCPCPLVLP